MQRSCSVGYCECEMLCGQQMSSVAIGSGWAPQHAHRKTFREISVIKLSLDPEIPQRDGPFRYIPGLPVLYRPTPIKELSISHWLAGFQEFCFCIQTVPLSNL